MTILPPGSILQIMHFLDKIKILRPGFFIEMGPGNGTLSKVLLEHKWMGVGVEEDKNTALGLTIKFKEYLEQGQYKVINKNFFETNFRRKADLVLSSMVIEHLAPKQELAFFNKSKVLLKKTGLLLCYVPGSPTNWGIEDVIAGHYRRYTMSRIRQKLISSGWMPLNVEGLTYPLSNVLLPVSNYLVNRYESKKIKMSLKKKTLLSGRREVPLKTKFPVCLKIFLNSFALYPFHCLQTIFKTHPKSLTIFFEAAPKYGSMPS
jgi:cyclopropane fatty-acyl-phospholipid synthase-like methyltransferase